MLNYNIKSNFWLLISCCFCLCLKLLLFHSIYVFHRDFILVVWLLLCGINSTFCFNRIVLTDLSIKKLKIKTSLCKSMLSDLLTQTIVLFNLKIEANIGFLTKYFMPFYYGIVYYTTFFQPEMHPHSSIDCFHTHW